MSTKRTFLDSGVLIAAARGIDDTALLAANTRGSRSGVRS
jgi:hypothetical protein